MEVSVAQADPQLADLVRRAESGEEVVVTGEGRPAVRLVAVLPEGRTPELQAALDLIAERNRRDPLPPGPLIGEDFEREVDRIVAAARGKALPGPCAARSQDFLYDEDGLPG